MIFVWKATTISNILNSCSCHYSTCIAIGKGTLDFSPSLFAPDIINYDKIPIGQFGEDKALH
jgi:hypothetical protein